jgi:hypothetical protein
MDGLLIFLAWAITMVTLATIFLLWISEDPFSDPIVHYMLPNLLGINLILIGYFCSQMGWV